MSKRVTLRIYHGDRIVMDRIFNNSTTARDYAQLVMEDGERAELHDGLYTDYFEKSPGGDKRKGIRK